MSLFKAIKEPSGQLALLISATFFIIGVLYTERNSNKIIAVYKIPENHKLLYDESVYDKLAVTSPKLGVIKENVYYADIYFWNEGSVSITPDIFAEELNMSLEESAEILDVKIVAESREKVSQFEVILRDDNIPTFGLTWKKLIPKDGVLIRAFYVSSEIVELHIGGILENGDELVDGVGFNPKFSSKWVALISATLFMLIFGIVHIVVFLFFVDSRYDKLASEVETPAIRIFLTKNKLYILFFFIVLYSTVGGRLIAYSALGVYDPPQEIDKEYSFWSS